MDPVAIVVMLAIGAVAGSLAGQIISGGGFGLVGNIIVGILGALIAGFLFPGFLAFDGLIGQIISATLGAVILLFIIGRLTARLGGIGRLFWIGVDVGESDYGSAKSSVRMS